VGAANVAGPTLGSLAGNFGLAPLLNKPVAIISDARVSGRSAEQAGGGERPLADRGAGTPDRCPQKPRAATSRGGGEGGCGRGGGSCSPNRGWRRPGGWWS